MAEMRPANPQFDSNKDLDREEIAFNLLRKNLPEDAIVLYNPILRNNRNEPATPDFVLLHPSFGVVMMEAKRWSLDSIAGVSGSDVKLKTRGLPVSTRHPLMQARDYVFALQKTLIKKCGDDPAIIHQNGDKAGKLAFHIPCQVAFMQTREADIPRYLAKFGDTLTEEEILTEETLESPHGLLACLRTLAERRGGSPRLSAATIRAVADAVTPSDATEDSMEKAVEDEQKRELERTFRKLIPAPEKESDIAAYNRSKENLLAVADNLKAIFSEKDPEGPSVRRMGEIRDEIEKDVFEVGIFGRTAVGKSALLNALFGERLLVSGNAATTKTITRIMRPDGERAHRDSVVHYKTWEELSGEVSSYAGMLIDFLAPGENLDLSRDGMRGKLEALVAQAPRTTKRDAVHDVYKYLKSLIAGWDAAGDRMGRNVPMSLKESTALCEKEENAIFIDSRDIYFSHEFTEDNMVFTDSPGVGSRIQQHYNRALNKARDVDAAVFVIDIGAPLQDAEQRFAAEVQHLRRNKPGNIVFVMNKIGTLKLIEKPGFATFDDAVNAECDQLRADLATDVGIVDPPIFAVDAQCAMLVKLLDKSGSSDAVALDMWENQGGALLRKAGLSENLKASRFDKLVEGLERTLRANKTRDFLNSKLGSLEEQSDLFKSGIKQEIAAFDKELTDLRAELERHEKASETTRQFVSKIVNFSIPGEIGKMKDEMAVDAKKLVDGDIEKALVRHMEQYFRSASKGAGKMPDFTAKQFWTDLMSDPALLEEVQDLINGLRDKYHKQYEEIRDANKDIITGKPMMAVYGENIDWKFHYEEIPTDASQAALAIKSVKPGFWQDVTFTLKDWTNFLLGGVNKVAGLAGLEIAGFDLGKARREILTESYRQQCTDAITADILEWTTRDQKHFVETSTQSFNDFMDDITHKLANCIHLLDGKQRERELRKNGLDLFQAKIEEALNNLASLKREIKLLNP